MFTVGFGESILLSEKSECLLIDCGYERPTYSISAIEKSLSKFKNKSAMLTHFHEDHINGFIAMESKGNIKFDTIYIPDIFTSNHLNITDLEIIRYILERMYCSSKKNSFTIWELLECLSAKKQSISLLQRNKNAFTSMNRQFDVLWPIPKEVVSKRLCNKIKETISENDLVRVETLSDKIMYGYLQLKSKEKDNYNDDLIGDIKNLIDKLSSDGFCNVNEKLATELIKTIRSDQNRISIVCQCDNNKPLLMTGDIPPTIMKHIALDDYSKSVPLHNHYYAIKAPHHGTDTYYFNFGCYTTYDNLLISNGKTNHTSRGIISCQYNLLRRSYSIRCTNYDSSRCECCLWNLQCVPCNANKSKFPESIKL
jgi:beta-lactamase superfamily II metal-dependent hydrolase